MSINKLFGLLLAGLSYSSSATIGGTISTMSGSPFCEGFLSNEGKLVTSQHCLFDKNGNPRNYIYFKSRYAGLKRFKVPSKKDLVKINNIDDISKDIIAIKNGEVVKIMDEGVCDGHVSKLYYKMNNDIFSCNVFNGKSGVFISQECVFEKGHSGKPMFSDKEMKKVCSVYSTTLLVGKSKSKVGISVKIRD